MSCLRGFRPAVALLALACAALAQDTVEHAAATANATSATATRGVGKSAASVMDKVAKTLGQAAAPASGSPTAVVLPGPAVKPESAVKVTAPDPALIAAGMDRKELLRKFGEPAMKTSVDEDSEDAETWWYGLGPETVTVKLVAGKVRTVSPPVRPVPAPRKPDTTVTVLP